MSVEVLTEKQARAAILAGARQVYEPVKVTLGPLGRPIILGGPFSPIPTKDGATVAKNIDIDRTVDETRGEGTGADLMRLAASKLDNLVGDGTTTVTILTYHLIAEAYKALDEGTSSPRQIERELKTASAEILACLPKYVQQVAGDSKKLYNIAKIAAGGDDHIAKIITEILETIGHDGYITVERSQELETTKEVIEGYQIPRGYVSPYLVTDPMKMEAVHEKPLVLITDQKLTSVAQITPLMERVIGTKRPIVIIAEDITTDVLATLVINKTKNVLTSVAIKPPAFGDRRREILDDLATLTGATVISENSEVTLENASIDALGQVDRIIVTADQTTLMGFQNSGEDRATALELSLEKIEDNDRKDYIKARVAALRGKIGIIKVGGKNDADIEEVKYRIDDAVGATKSAVEEGIVAGAGVTFINLSNAYAAGQEGDTVGAGILLAALKQPLYQLFDNSGLELTDEMVERISHKPGRGYNVMHPNDLIDLKQHGIIDAAKVTRQAIESAVSVASTAILAGGLIIPSPTELRINRAKSQA